MDSRLLAERAAFWPSAAWGAGLAPLTGAEAFWGGWLLVAPGMPVGWGGFCSPVLSTTCWLRTTPASEDWLGRCCSEVDSVWLKSISAETCAFTLLDRKSTRLNSSHLVISYAVFCLKTK